MLLKPLKAIKYFFNADARIRSGAVSTIGFSNYVENNYFHNQEKAVIDWNCYAFLACERGYSQCLADERRYGISALACSIAALLLAVSGFLDLKFLQYFVATKNTVNILLIVLWFYLTIKQWNTWIAVRVMRLVTAHHLLKLNSLLDEQRFDITKEPISQVRNVLAFCGSRPLSNMPEHQTMDQMFKDYADEHLKSKRSSRTGTGS